MAAANASSLQAEEPQAWATAFGFGCWATSSQTRRCDAVGMRCDALQTRTVGRCRGRELVDQGEAAGGGQRGGVTAGVGESRDEGACRALDSGDDMGLGERVGSGARHSNSLHDQISASSPSARPCSGPYSRIANVGSAELGRR